MMQYKQAAWMLTAASLTANACGGSSVIEPGGGAGGTGTGTTPTGTTPTGTTPTGTTPTGSPACGLGTVGAQPPPPAANADPPVSGKVAFALSELLVGDRDWSGTPSPAAWQQFGYNVDDRISTRESTDLCSPAAGATPSKVYPDGDDGIDNGFGKNVLPLFMGLEPDFPVNLNARIQAGENTLLIEVAGLGPGASYTDLYGTSWRGAELGLVPAFDGSDTWPPYEGTDGSLLCGYATNHTVVLTAGTSIELPLVAFGDVPWQLELHRPIVTLELAPDHTTITRGVIAGLLSTDQLIDQFRSIAGSFDPALCAGSTFESIADQFRQASDILEDGTQSPALPCNAISLGMGFRGSLVTLGAPEAPPPPPPDPCL